MVEDFDRLPTTKSDPASWHWPITPNDAANLPLRPRAIFCVADGTIVMRDEGGQDLSYPMTAGQYLPFRPVRILATGTTGTFYGWA